MSHSISPIVFPPVFSLKLNLSTFLWHTNTIHHPIFLKNRKDEVALSNKIPKTSTLKLGHAREMVTNLQ